SISHSAGIAVAVARAAGPGLPLGCDLELRPLPRAAARLVLREDEEELLDDRDEPFHAGSRLTGAGWTVTELFSAKEAAWKALAGTGTDPDPDLGLGLACLGEAGETPQGLRPARPTVSLRDLRVGPAEDGLCVVRPRADPARAVRVRVVRVGTGVFGYVLDPSPGLGPSAALI
ncbi:4'-phosphopantetheinyl transferase superfamily protein, partial [Streptomyces rochei]|uniref:4'-phosphopantetheinyl transferase superfamily protein n=1 Tax=Streptomyces rochei TaxID=1928 RepID=UPI0013BACB22